MCRLAVILIISFLAACSTDRNLDRAKQSGLKYWTEKAYPGKAYSVQVTHAEKAEEGKYKVLALVDGEQRVGFYNPQTQAFDEGLYPLSHERGKRIAELEQEIRFLKERLDKMEKENYQLNLRLKYAVAGKGDPEKVADSKQETPAEKE